MVSEMLQILHKAKEDRVFPGCVVGVIDGENDQVIPFGTLTYEMNAYPVTEETIYDVASITKAIPTSSLALVLLDHDKISLQDKIIAYIPELKMVQREEITIFHLLTQTLDFDLRLSQEKQLPATEMWQKILTTPLKQKPGTSYSYTNATSILLGHVVERVSGKSLDSLAQEVFFHPLEMMKTTFHPDTFIPETIAPSEIDAWRGREIRGEVHDESAYVLRDKLVVGSAGLFSTVPDLMRFLRMLLEGGTYKENRFFSERIIEMMAINQIEHMGESTGLGWELHQEWYMGEYISRKTIGKTGFTGCHVMVDLKRKKALVLLSNSTYPKRPKTKDDINTVRRELANIVFKDK